MEEFIKLPFISNALGRWIKVSNRGLMDEDRRMHGPIRQRRAQTRLGVRQIIDTLNNQEALTEAEKHLLWDPYALDYLLRTWPQTQMNRASPLLRRLNSARSQEEKMEILKREVGAQRQ
jgi:hypothetical protein